MQLELFRPKAAAVALIVCAGLAPAQTQARKTTPPATARPSVSPAKTPPKPVAKSAVKPAAKRAAITTARKPAPSAARSAAKPGAAGASHAKSGSTRSASARRVKKPAAPPRRPRQMVPAPERYKEIQQALVSKGYLGSEEASGVWDQNCTDALKRFQGDQKLQGTGKIDSLSLIALGLGPKHASLETKAAFPAPPDQNTAQEHD